MPSDFLARQELSKSKGFDVNERENKKAKLDDLHKLAGRMFTDHDKIGGGGASLDIASFASTKDLTKKFKLGFRGREQDLGDIRGMVDNSSDAEEEAADHQEDDMEAEEENGDDAVAGDAKSSFGGSVSGKSVVPAKKDLPTKDKFVMIDTVIATACRTQAVWLRRAKTTCSAALKDMEEALSLAGSDDVADKAHDLESAILVAASR